MIQLLIALLISINAVQAIELELGYGRFSIIDFGSLIKSRPIIVDETKARVYPISGLTDEESKSIVAIQGLKKTGATDLTVDTQAGIYQFHLKLVQNQGQDLALSPNTRSKIYQQKFTTNKSRSSIVQMPSYINQYILTANPSLVSYKNIKDYYDRDFLKTFALISKAQGVTDIVVPTQAGVYKFTLEIGENNNENHHSFIDFSSSATTGIQ